MKVIAVANQKGGAGKSTAARHLAYYGVEGGLRVLCADFDPQRNFSNSCRRVRMRNLGDMGEEVASLMTQHLFSGKKTAASLRPLDCGEGLHLIAAERELADVGELPIKNLDKPREALRQLEAEYDICIIDTAPTLGKPLYAALIAADFVVSPCPMDQDAIDGLSDLFEDIARVQQLGWNADLVSLGVLANKVSTIRAFDLRALEDLRAGLGDVLLKSVLYDRAATKYAKDRPVWRGRSGESQLLAAREMKSMCQEVFSKAGL